jgi:hypothetical protein
MSKKYDVVATTGTYQKDGETKYVNRNVGAVIQTKHGFRLALDASFNPAGCPKTDDGKVYMALFEPRDNDQGNGQSNASGSHSGAQGGGSFDGPADDEGPPFITRNARW